MKQNMSDERIYVKQTAATSLPYYVTKKANFNLILFFLYVCVWNKHQYSITKILLSSFQVTQSGLDCLDFSLAENGKNQSDFKHCKSWKG